jgi:hypothetical protein
MVIVQTVIYKQEYFKAGNDTWSIELVLGADAQKPLAWDGRLSIPEKQADLGYQIALHGCFVSG